MGWPLHTSHDVACMGIAIYGPHSIKVNFVLVGDINHTVKKVGRRGAAIAQWIRQGLPSCWPRFESHSHHLCLHRIMFELCHVEKTKTNKNRPGLVHLKNKSGSMSGLFLWDVYEVDQLGNCCYSWTLQSNQNIILAKFEEEGDG